MEVRVHNFLRSLGESVFALIIGASLGALIFGLSGHSPLDGLFCLIFSPLTTEQGLIITLTFATPLVLTALTWAVGIKAGLYNVGAQGQYLAGVAGALLTAYYAPILGVSPIFTIILSMLAGILWSLPVAYLKAKRGVHEVISTIMLNWVAIYLLRYLVLGPFYKGSGWSLPIPANARIPLLYGTVSIGIFIAVLFAIFTYFYLWHTKGGVHLRAAGFARETTRNVGINVTSKIITAFLIGGAAAGLAGGLVVAGMPPDYQVATSLLNVLGFAFSGIAVAMIGGNHPISIIPAAIFFGALRTGGRSLQVKFGVSPEIVMGIMGIIVIAMAVPEVVHMMSRRRRKT